MIEHGADIVERHRKALHAGDADDSHGAAVGQHREQGEQILHLGPLEETAEKKYGNSECFELLAQGRELLVARAEHGLIAISVPGSAHLLDGLRHGDDLLAGFRHRAVLGGDAARPRARRSAAVSGPPAFMRSAKLENASTISRRER